MQVQESPSQDALLAGTLTFLFTDVEDSTPLWERDPEAMGAALARHDAIIETMVQQHDGQIVKPRGEGDSRFAVFPRATDAVAAAVAIQRTLQAETWRTPKPIRIRIALHTGEADLRAGDYYGTAVNRCARLRALAHSGQILLSQVTSALVRDQVGHGELVGLGIRALGEMKLKGLSQPELVFQLVAPGLPERFPPLKPARVPDRNRSRLLAKVRHFWVEGVLENSLGGAALLTLGLEHRPELVANPWSLEVQWPEHRVRMLPLGTTVVDVFDELDGELLILGAPGAGKTTLLLELARELAERAERNPAHPLPVVFNLASWSARRQPLTLWLVDELNVRYDVPRSLAQDWVESGALLPLLDGLDEVQAEQRSRCADYVNAFRQYHGVESLVVCCRTAEYDMLKTRLKLQGAIAIQPLTVEQIDTYLQAGEGRTAALRDTLRGDPQLLELARSPLMLSVMTLAYESTGDVRPAESGSMEEHRTRVFGAYVARMFQRRGTNPHFSQEESIGWLAWLARGMREHNQSIFYLERMQPTWLPRSDWRLYYLLVALVLGLFAGLLTSPGAGLNFGMLLGVSTALSLLVGGENQLAGTRRWSMIRRIGFGLVIGLSMAVCIGLLLYLSENAEMRAVCLRNGALAGLVSCVTFVVVHRLAVRLGEVAHAGLAIGVSIGAGVGLTVAAADWMTGAPLAVAIFEGFIFAVGSGFLAGMYAGLLVQNGREIKVVEVLHWAWRRSVTAALVGVVSVGLIVGPGVSWEAGLLWGLRAGLIAGLIVGLAGGEMEVKSTPNQGIRRSAVTLLAGIVGGFLVWFVFGSLQTPNEPLTLTAQTALRAGLIVGLIWGFRAGLVALCQHLVLRFLLYRRGAVPITYVHFLDFAADHIFLRKVGGGYIFVHQLLQEFLAVYNTRAGKPSVRDVPLGNTTP